MAKAKKAEKPAKGKAELALPAGKPGKVKKEPKRHEAEADRVKAVKVKPEKAKKQPKPGAGPCGITGVNLVTVPPDEPASCGFEAATGCLTLRIPQAQAGPAGLQGPEGTHGKAGKGLDYSRAPGGKEEFFLLVDEAGRLAYSARGTVSLVNLTPVE